MSAGTLQRARKTPTTMMSEITSGERPMETSLVGASAAPSHAPAVNPDRIPSSCNLRAREASRRGDMVGQCGRLIQSDREKRSDTALAGPDTGGEAADGREVEIFVETDRGAVLRGHGQSQFAELHGAQGFRGSLHEHAAKSVPLIAGQDADLRGVAGAGGDFAGEHSGDEFVAAGLAENEGGGGHELAAPGEKNNVLE